MTTVKRYPGQMHGFFSNAKLLPKAYDAIEMYAANVSSESVEWKWVGVGGGIIGWVECGWVGVGWVEYWSGGVMECGLATASRWLPGSGQP